MKHSLVMAGVVMALVFAIILYVLAISMSARAVEWPGSVNTSPGPPWPPPQRFDYPYRGQLTVHTIKHERQMEFYCGKPTPGYFKAGCAIVRPNECIVYILDAEPREFRMTAAQIAVTLRHEIAHCNGWKHEEDER